ncbi:MAG: hypothetical protein WBV28_18565 [Terracidiphilus sp.]
MRRFPRLIRTPRRKTIIRGEEFEFLAEVLTFYRQRAYGFPETKGSGAEDFELLKLSSTVREPIDLDPECGEFY